jgi:replication factor A1
MEKNKSEIFEMIKDLMSKEDFEREVQTRFDSYEGLLNKDAVAYLIVDEMGRNVIESKKISDLKNGDSVSISVFVEGLGEVREFKRKDGTPGRVANLTVSDKAGFCRFTLWNKDVEAIQNLAIKVGSKIKIVNGYVKVTDFGTEISTGRWGMFSVENED